MKEEKIEEILTRGMEILEKTAYQKKVTALLRKKGEDPLLNSWERDKVKYYETAEIPEEVLVSVIIDHRNVMW